MGIEEYLYSVRTQRQLLEREQARNDSTQVKQLDLRASIAQHSYNINRYGFEQAALSEKDPQKEYYSDLIARENLLKEEEEYKLSLLNLEEEKSRLLKQQADETIAVQRRVEVTERLAKINQQLSPCIPWLKGIQDLKLEEFKLSLEILDIKDEQQKLEKEFKVREIEKKLAILDLEFERDLAPVGLELGVEGQDVTNIRTLLTRLGIVSYSSDEPQDLFTVKLKQAISDFQKKQELVVTGIWDEVTKNRAYQILLDEKQKELNSLPAQLKKAKENPQAYRAAVANEKQQSPQNSQSREEEAGTLFAMATTEEDEPRVEQKQAEDYFKLGINYFEQGNSSEAIRYFQKAIELAPDFAASYYNLGVVYYAQGNLSEAIKYYQKAIELDPNLAQAYINLGAAYTEQGDLSEAVKFLQKAIEIAPRFYPQAYMNLGLVYKHQDNLSDAIKYLQKAIEIDPNYAEAYYNLGWVYDSQSNFAEAIKYYQKAIELDPNYVSAYNNLGLVYSNQGNLAEAVKYLQKAIELDPNHITAYNNLGSAFKDQGNFSEAIKYLQKAIEIAPGHAELYSNLGVIHLKQGNLSEAIKYSQKAIEIDPNFTQAYLNLSFLYYCQGMFSDSVLYSKQGTKDIVEKVLFSDLNMEKALEAGDEELAKREFAKSYGFFIDFLNTDLLKKHIRNIIEDTRLFHPNSQLPKPERDVVVFIVNSGVNAKSVGGKIKGDLVDSLGHGTLVAKIIRKISPNSEIVSLYVSVSKAKNEVDADKLSIALMRILVYIRENPQTKVVINLSLRRPLINHNMFIDAVLISVISQLGGKVVVAAGNEGSAFPLFPASYPSVIAVAALNRDGGKVYNSNYGPNIDIAAPGWMEISKGHEVEATSFAAPRVSGLLTEILIRNPEMSTQEAYEIIEQTADPIDIGLYEQGMLGKGAIDIKEALEKAKDYKRKSPTKDSKEQGLRINENENQQFAKLEGTPTQNTSKFATGSVLTTQKTKQKPGSTPQYDVNFSISTRVVNQDGKTDVSYSLPVRFSFRTERTQIGVSATQGTNTRAVHLDFNRQINKGFRTGSSIGFVENRGSIAGSREGATRTYSYGANVGLYGFNTHYRGVYQEQFTDEAGSGKWIGQVTSQTYGTGVYGINYNRNHSQDGDASVLNINIFDNYAFKQWLKFKLDRASLNVSVYTQPDQDSRAYQTNSRLTLVQRENGSANVELNTFTGYDGKTSFRLTERTQFNPSSLLRIDNRTSYVSNYSSDTDNPNTDVDTNTSVTFKEVKGLTLRFSYDNTGNDDRIYIEANGKPLGFVPGAKSGRIYLTFDGQVNVEQIFVNGSRVGVNLDDQAKSIGAYSRLNSDKIVLVLGGNYIYGEENGDALNLHFEVSNPSGDIRVRTNYFQRHNPENWELKSGFGVGLTFAKWIFKNYPVGLTYLQPPDDTRYGTFTVGLTDVFERLTGLGRDRKESKPLGNHRGSSSGAPIIPGRYTYGLPADLANTKQDTNPEVSAIIREVMTNEKYEHIKAYLIAVAEKQGINLRGMDFERGPPVALDKTADLVQANEFVDNTLRELFRYLFEALRAKHYSKIYEFGTYPDNQLPTFPRDSVTPEQGKSLSELDEALALLANQLFRDVFNNPQGQYNTGEDFPRDPRTGRYTASVFAWIIGAITIPYIGEGHTYPDADAYLNPNPPADLPEVANYLINYINGQLSQTQRNNFTYVQSLDTITPPVWIGPYRGANGSNPYGDFADLGRVLFSLAKGPTEAGVDANKFFTQDTPNVAGILLAMVRDTNYPEFRNAFNDIFETQLNPTENSSNIGQLSPSERERHLTILYNVVNPLNQSFNLDNFVHSTRNIGWLIGQMRLNNVFHTAFIGLFHIDAVRPLSEEEIKALYALVNPEGRIFEQDRETFVEILPTAVIVYNWYVNNFGSINRSTLESLYGIEAGAPINIINLFNLLVEHNDNEELVGRLIFSQAYDLRGLPPTTINERLNIFADIIDEAVVVFNWYQANLSNL
ncbi:MAG: tetratricopeptide repeat protein, partial [Candidatus Omnitrophota bacterium]|nr:tetratricopeptide repeat protein [Candidatus Omnitrophota bacterium]